VWARPRTNRWGRSWNERATPQRGWGVTNLVGAAKSAEAMGRAGFAQQADAWADAICREIGKPRGEAMAEVVMSLDSIRWTIRPRGPKPWLTRVFGRAGNPSS